jgi:hypothetical protein
MTLIMPFVGTIQEPSLSTIKMRSTLVFPNILLPSKSVELGRLVLNVHHPQQDFFEPSSITESQITVGVQQNFAEILNGAKSTKLRSFLTRLIMASYSNRDSNCIQLSAFRATTYQLINSGDWFDKVCGDPETRKWLERAIERGQDVYLVVGYHTLLNAQFSQRNESALQGSGQAQISVGALAGEGADDALANGILDAGLSGARHESHTHQRCFTAPGEQIYAVQYRKVDFKWFSSRSVDNAFLESNNRWKIFWEVRGKQNDENNVLEADVVDGIDFERACDIYITEDGQEEFLFELDV